MKNDSQIVSLPLRIVRHFPLYLNWIREKTAEGVEGVTCRGEIDAYGGNEQTYVCQNNRIIVKSYHLQAPLFRE